MEFATLPSSIEQSNQLKEHLPKYDVPAGLVSFFSYPAFDALDAFVPSAVVSFNASNTSRCTYPAEPVTLFKPPSGHSWNLTTYADAFDAYFCCRCLQAMFKDFALNSSSWPVRQKMAFLRPLADRT